MPLLLYTHMIDLIGVWSFLNGACNGLLNNELVTLVWPDSKLEIFVANTIIECMNKMLLSLIEIINLLKYIKWIKSIATNISYVWEPKTIQ